MIPLAFASPAIPAVGYALYYMLNRRKIQSTKKFEGVLFNKGVKVGSTESPKYPQIVGFKKKLYGFDMKVRLPEGMNYSEFELIVPALETAWKAEVRYTYNEFEGHARLQVAMEAFKSEDFVPVPQKPNEVYLGKTRYFETILIDLNKFPDLLIMGSIGSGKSRIMYLMLANLMASCSPEEVEIYLTQLEKVDLWLFAKYPHVKYFAEDLKRAKKMLLHLEGIMKGRNNLYKKYLNQGVLNISDYNKRFPTKKQSYIWLFGDEFSYYMPQKTDDDDTKELKLECIRILESLVKAGRSAGILVFLAVQVPDFRNMPTFIRSNMNTKVGFRSSKNAAKLVFDDTETVGLPIGEAIVETNERFRVKIPLIDTKIIELHIGKQRDMKHRYLDLDPKPVVEPTQLADFKNQEQIKKNMGVIE